MRLGCVLWQLHPKRNESSQQAAVYAALLLCLTLALGVKDPMEVVMYSRKSGVKHGKPQRNMSASACVLYGFALSAGFAGPDEPQSSEHSEADACACRQVCDAH